jgi:hypothetical protein
MQWLCVEVKLPALDVPVEDPFVGEIVTVDLPGPQRPTPTGASGFTFCRAPEIENTSALAGWAEATAARPATEAANIFLFINFLPCRLRRASRGKIG